MRIDIALTKLGISRNAAQTLIKSGKVIVGGVVVVKPSFEVPDAGGVQITEYLKYVGRGGYKLEHALETFNIDVRGRVCLDVGASTGGFTDCLLQKDALKVYAVDVGKNQLAPRIFADERVVCMEKTDIRNLDKIDCDTNFICVDVSFISLRLILPQIYNLVCAARENVDIVALVKPQFESGKINVGKNGIVRSEKVREETVADIIKFSENIGFKFIAKTNSPITGGEGNAEYLIQLLIANR